MLLSKTENRGQWGISSDDYGRHYHNGNSSAALGEYLRPNSLINNPGLQFAVEANTLGSNHVFPIRINPGVNRAYLPNTLVAEGPNKGKLNKYTAASGNNLFLGDQFPEEFYGTLYIVDMYHGVIQHADYLTSYLREQYESRDLHKHNAGMGRIYRLRWAERPIGTSSNMAQENPKTWVSHLEHPNGWWRDMARQLIVQNYEQSLVPHVKKTIQKQPKSYC